MLGGSRGRDILKWWVVKAGGSGGQGTLSLLHPPTYLRINWIWGKQALTVSLYKEPGISIAEGSGESSSETHLL